MLDAAVSVRAPETRRGLPPSLCRWAAALWHWALLSRGEPPAARQPPETATSVTASNGCHRAQGEEDARALADRLYQEHARAVLAYLCARLPALHDAEDVLADVFLAALAQCATTEAPGIGWLLTVARRRVADFYRRRRATADLPASFAAAAAMGPEEHALRAEELREVIARVARLPEDQRDALALRFAAGMRSPQIAAILGKSEEATRALLSRALRRLRKELAQ
jgi:RNA polymerase sigma-70 factor, ECF subfamily